MSLYCGNCRQIIHDGFGLLYRIERRIDGKLVFPEDTKEATPNCAICDACWARFPEAERLKGDAIRAEMEARIEPVYIYQSADSGRTPSTFGSAKQWSSIEPDPKTTVFLRTSLAERRFKRAIEIIDDMSRSLSAPENRAN